MNDLELQGTATRQTALAAPAARSRRLAAIVAFGCVGVASALTAALPASAASTPSAEGGAVGATTDHAEATRAALDVLHAGGNAVDGAIAAALTLGVVGPMASGIGGGGFALVYMKKDQKVIALDFRESAPAKVDPERVLTRNDSPNRGAYIGVPGEPAGLEWLHTRYGKRSLAADALPAADVAARGFPLGHHMAEGLPHFKERVAPSSELMRLFYPAGAPLPYRTLVRRPDLARTILRFGAEGSRPFYSGDLAAKIVAAARAAGSPMEASDLEHYRVREREPLTRTFGTRTVATMPAPSAGGLMLLEALVMYGADSKSPLAAMGFGSSEYLHTVASIMRGAVADRARVASDPDVEPSVAGAYQQLLQPEQMAARKARIDPNKTLNGVEFKTQESGTSHLVVADAEGNVVSLTTTVNGPFGARVVAGDTGILLNDELSDFSSPAEVAPFGVTGPGLNRPRANARPVSSMTPTIVLENGMPILAVGGSGGTRIATNVLQATLARLVFGLEPTACISAPRIAINGTNAEISLEPEIVEDVRAGLRARGEVVKDERFLGTGVQMIAWDRKPGVPFTVLAATDPRKSGLAAAQ
jgi:gamma-glutamyltranspeptidase/glutathione hydrolase